MESMLHGFWVNFTHNLFKPLLLFFFAGFLVPILQVKLEFPKVLYQSLTIYLLIAIGWHGGEELAALGMSSLGSVVTFMGIGFITNAFIGVLAYNILKRLHGMRRIDAATIAGYYGSDSAGTFVTCLGVLATAQIAMDAYMPVMLAVMEIPGCLVALFLVTRLRRIGLDKEGNLPGEVHLDALSLKRAAGAGAADLAEIGMVATADLPTGRRKKKAFSIDLKLLHEVFFNSGIFLLFAGILIGFISRSQGAEVVKADDYLLVNMFQGALCLFLLEMGITASTKLRHLKTAGWSFIAFALLTPPCAASLGILIACGFSHVVGTPLQLGSYVLFGCLCGSASYIAVPAVQRLAIPEASPTLPLAASLGLTFTFNVTVGIPLYIEIAKKVMETCPLAA